MVNHCNHHLEVIIRSFFPSLTSLFFGEITTLVKSAYLCLYPMGEKQHKQTDWSHFESMIINLKWAHDVACQSHHTYFTVLFSHSEMTVSYIPKPLILPPPFLLSTDNLASYLRFHYHKYTSTCIYVHILYPFSQPLLRFIRSHPFCLFTDIVTAVLFLFWIISFSFSPGLFPLAL